MLIRDANRTRPCECERKATEVRIVQNGQETVRIAADLKPLDFYHLERGYEHLVEKLRGVGARIAKVSDDMQDPEEMRAAMDQDSPTEGMPRSVGAAEG